MSAGIPFCVVAFVNGITSFIAFSNWLLIREKLFDFYKLILIPIVYLKSIVSNSVRADSLGF